MTSIRLNSQIRYNHYPGLLLCKSLQLILLLLIKIKVIFNKEFDLRDYRQKTCIRKGGSTYGES